MTAAVRTMAPRVALDIPAGEALGGAVTFAACSHIGAGGREGNEDAVLLAPEVGLFGVADGMGGAAAGEVASALSVRVVRDHVREQFRHAQAAEERRDLLVGAVGMANTRVFEAAGNSPSWKGMGSTFAGVLLRWPHLAVAHVGDSRLYRLQGATLEQLTEDHALGGMYRNVITRALGTKDAVAIDTKLERVAPGDVYLLCTHGLSNVAKKEAIGLCLQSARSVGPRQALSDLMHIAIGGANGHGGNVSGLILVVEP